MKNNKNKSENMVKKEDSVVLTVYLHEDVKKRFKLYHADWKAAELKKDNKDTTQNHFITHLLKLEEERVKDVSA